MAERFGVDADTVLESLTPEQFAKFQARHQVIPYDHAEKMLGMIALMIARYLGQEVDENICMPWVDTSPEAQLAAATGN